MNEVPRFHFSDRTQDGQITTRDVVHEKYVIVVKHFLHWLLAGAFQHSGIRSLEFT